MIKICTSILLFIPLFLFGQGTSIVELKQNAREIKGRHVTQDFELDQNDQKELESILNLDVFEYFNLNDQYSTPLQREVFKKTSDYKSKEVELKAIKENLVTQKCFIDFEMTYYEQHNLQYSTNSHSFNYDVDISAHNFYNQNSIQLGPVVLAKPQNILLGHRQFEAGGSDIIRQTVGLVITDIEKALTVENNRENLRVLFVFNFTGTKMFKNNIIGFQFIDYFLLTKLDRVALYNASTQEIYCSYLPSANKLQKQSGKTATKK